MGAALCDAEVPLVRPQTLKMWRLYKWRNKKLILYQMKQNSSF